MKNKWNSCTHTMAVAVVVEGEGGISLAEIEYERLRLAHADKWLRVRSVGSNLRASEGQAGLMSSTIDTHVLDVDFAY